MSYIIWPMIGVIVAVLIGASPRRRAYRPNANAAIAAGAFGGLIGGAIGDGVAHELITQVTIPSIVAAVAGALLFCWAVRERASDLEP